jgi:acetoin utilization deacetylase AcuC-like enzyme
MTHDERDENPNKKYDIYTEYVESVLSGDAVKDASTYFHRKESKSSDAARLAAGGTLQVTEAVCSGQAANGFCATRPPGHHAEPEHMMGFCIFNRYSSLLFFVFYFITFY